MSIWKRINTAAYTMYYGLRSRRIAGKSRRTGVTLDISIDNGKPPVLYISWGRIGDAVLATGHLKHLRSAFPDHPIWCLGRPETATVVRPYIDIFMGFGQDAWMDGGPEQQELISQLSREFICIIADIHMFYGGVFVMRSLLEQLSAPSKFIYEGYCLDPGLAPHRAYPTGFEIIEQRLRNKATDDLTDRHVLHDADYYFKTILDRCQIGYVPDETRPELSCEPGFEDTCERFGLEPCAFTAWQPVSNNPKKDYPLHKWQAVLTSFPEQTFVALGTDAERKGMEGFTAENLRNLCGQTNLAETLQLIRGSGFFMGLDSGLSHISAVLGQRTVCVTQSSNLGYFFPYPEIYGFTGLQTVHNPDYVACSGCFMTCRYESILTTYRKGARCLRTLPVDPVIDAVRVTIDG